MLTKKKHTFYWMEQKQRDSKGRSEVSQSGFYSRKEWTTTRAYYAYLNPHCEHCLKKEPSIIKALDEVHHIRPLTLDDISNNNLDILYSEQNLMSVCRQCHTINHNRDEKINYKLFDRMNNIKKGTGGIISS